MRDKEIESLLLGARPRGLSDAARRQILEAMLSTGSVRSTRWWQRPVALWKAAAVLLAAVGLIWSGMARWRSNAIEQDDLAADQTSRLASSAHLTYVDVDPSMFQGGQRKHVYTANPTEWQVLSKKIGPQKDEGSR
jgi:hypothetical protein